MVEVLIAQEYSSCSDSVVLLDLTIPFSNYLKQHTAETAMFSKLCESGKVT